MMEYFVKTYHDYTDEIVNRDIAKLTKDKWEVKHFNVTTQELDGKLKSCVVILYTRSK